MRMSKLRNSTSLTSEGFLSGWFYTHLQDFDGGLYRKLFEDQNAELMRRGAGDQLDLTVDRLSTVPSFSMVPTERVAAVAHLLTNERYPAGQQRSHPSHPLPQRGRAATMSNRTCRDTKRG